MNIPIYENPDGWWFFGIEEPIGPYTTQETAKEKYLMYYQFISAPECHHP